MRRPDSAPVSDQELRMRAAGRVARKRAFFMSLMITGSLITLNLFLYEQSHNSMFLILDGVFAVVLAIRAFAAFGPDASEDKIRLEMDRMRPAQTAGSAMPPAPPPPPADPNDMWK